VSIRMDDRTDGQSMDDGTHGYRGGFISHPHVLYYIGLSLMFHHLLCKAPIGHQMQRAPHDLNYYVFINFQGSHA